MLRSEFGDFLRVMCWTLGHPSLLNILQHLDLEVKISISSELFRRALSDLGLKYTFSK